MTQKQPQLRSRLFCGFMNVVGGYLGDMICPNCEAAYTVAKTKTLFMQEYNLVYLLKDLIDDEGTVFKKNTIATIVHKYDVKGIYEVEIVDSDGITIGLLTVDESCIAPRYE